MADLGYYTVPVILSFSDVSAQATKELDDAFKKAAPKAGKDFGEQFGKATADAVKPTGTAGKAIEKAQTDTAKQTGAKAGKTYGQEYGKAAGEELKPTATTGRAVEQAQSQAAKQTGQKHGKEYGEAMGRGAEQAATESSSRMGRAMQRAGKAAGDFFGSEFGKEITNTLATEVGAAIGERLHDIPIVAQTVDTLKDIGDRASVAGDALGKMQGALAGIKGGGAQGLAGVQGSLGSVQALLAATQQLAGAGGIKIPGLQGISGALGGAQSFVGNAQQTAGALKGMGDIMAMLPGKVGALGGSLAGLAGPIGAAVAGIAGIAELGWNIYKSEKERPMREKKEAEAHFRELQSAVKEIVDTPMDKVIKVHMPTEEVKTQLQNLGFAIKELPDGNIQVTADTTQAKNQVDLWRKAVEADPVSPDVTPNVDTTKADQQMKNFVDEWSKVIISPTIAPTGTAENPYHATPGDAGSMLLPPGARAGGGAISGPGGPRSDTIPIWASNGEHMWSADDVNAAGGHDNVYRLRAAIRSGAMRAYQGGGRVQAGINFARSVGDGRRYDYGGVGPGYDCSGYMSAIYAAFTGKPQGTRYFSTESNFEALGFVRGSSPGAFNIGIHRGGGGPNSHMAGTLPNGVRVESGGSHNSTMYGDGAAGADSSQFELHYYLPIGRGEDPNAAVAGAESLGGAPAGVIGGAPSGAGGGGGGLPSALAGGGAGGGGGGGAGGGGVFSQMLGKALGMSGLDSQTTQTISSLAGIAEGGLLETLTPQGFPNIEELAPVQAGATLLSAFMPVLEGAAKGKLGIQQPGWSPGQPIPAPEAGAGMGATGGGGMLGPTAGPTVNVDQSMNIGGNVGADPAKVQQDHERAINRRALPNIPVGV